MNRSNSPLRTLKQKGAALVVFFMAIILTGAVFLISDLGPDFLRINAQNKSSSSLAKAKEALISHAISYYFANTPGHHGFLPCPETSASASEGSSIGNCTQYANQLGRLPWKTLQINPLKDSAGECLWYAISGSFLAGSTSRAEMLNDDTPGMFQTYTEAGNILNGTVPEDRVVAVVFSPGRPIGNQTRPNVTAGLPCNVPRDQVAVTNYLEGTLQINNSDVNGLDTDVINKFIQSDDLSDNQIINDRFISITVKEIFDVIKNKNSMYRDKITTLGIELGQCLQQYAQRNAANCDDIVLCNDSCDDARRICRLTAQPGLELAQCNRDSVSCRSTCTSSCISSCNSGNNGNNGNNGNGNNGNGNGNNGNNGNNGSGNNANNGCSGSSGGTPVYRLPWAALTNLNSDYRNKNNYIDNSDVTTNGYLGRLPYITTNSTNTIEAITGETFALTNNLFEFCAIESDPSKAEIFNLWQNWKDHWFYVVGSDFAPDATAASTPPCSNCPQVNSGSRYAAVLIFSDQRINSKLRRTNETEKLNPPILANSKAVLSNYLEGSNLSNDGDTSGNLNYGLLNQNDRLFCIPEDLSPPAATPTNLVFECTP